MNFVTFGKRGNPAVLFLHGWGGNIKSFEFIAKVFSSFGFFAIVVDFKGFGESPEPTNPYSVLDYANDCFELLKELNIKKVSIIGHSFGGRVAIKLSSRYPYIVNKLVLVDSAGLRPRRGLIYLYKVKKFKVIRKLVTIGLLNKSKLSKLGSRDYKILSPNMKETFKRVVNEDLSEDTKTIKVSTLIVWGKKDKDTPIYMARRLHKLIEKSRLIVYNAGHFSYIECLEDFIEDVSGFLL